MLAVDAKRRKAPKPLTGRAYPRIAPPVPARNDVAAFRETAAGMGIELMPWQETAARYLTAKGHDNRLLYREVAIVVARQNGKTTLMKPAIIRALRDGKKVLHLAQNRELPRQMFGVIADALSNEPELFPKRRGKTIWPRYGAGQEEITLINGGWYRIAAANRGGARGWPTDMVIFDELREQTEHDVMGAIEPTLLMSPDPQLIELSNAGAEDSVVLNAVRARAGEDPALAYLEWSAAPERDAGDVDGWAEANPALGHNPSVMRGLETAYRKAKLAGTMALFETEHLCRWVTTMAPRAVDVADWTSCHGPLEKPIRPVMAISMDPSGTRASAALAWQQTDGTVGMKLVAEMSAEGALNTAAVGKDLEALSRTLRASIVGFDPWTDGELARFFKNAKKIQGVEWGNACTSFAIAVQAGQLRWDEADAVTDDLGWTVRRKHDSGAWMFGKAKDDRPIPAALAAVRAVSLALGPRPAAPKVY